MFAVSWKVETPGGEKGRMFLAGYGAMFGEQTAVLHLACRFPTEDDAEAAIVAYAAKNPELLGRFEVVLVKYKDVGYGKMKAYWEGL